MSLRFSRAAASVAGTRSKRARDLVLSQCGDGRRREKKNVDAAESLLDVEEGVLTPVGGHFELPANTGDGGTEETVVDLIWNRSGGEVEGAVLPFEVDYLGLVTPGGRGRPVDDEGGGALDARDVVVGEGLLCGAPLPEGFAEGVELSARRDGVCEGRDEQRDEEDADRLAAS